MAVVDRGALHYLGGSVMAGKALLNVLKAAGKLVGPIMELLSPKIREALVRFVLEWEVDAKATPNLYDDVGVDMVRAILGIDDKPLPPKAG